MPSKRSAPRSRQSRASSVEVTCRRCDKVWDLSELKPGKPFKCGECGAINRAPKKKGPPVPLILGGVGGVVVIVVIIALIAGGGGEENKKSSTPERTAAAPEPKPEPKPEPEPEPKRQPGPIDRKYEELKKAAVAAEATAEDAYAVAEFCSEKGKRFYGDKMREWAELAIERNPRHEWAHFLLGRVEFLGDWIPEAEKEKRLAQPWFARAWEVRERKFLQDQALRDLGLIYHASMPFVIAKERNDRLALRDTRELQELGAILGATYQRFYSLFGERFKLPPADGSSGKPFAIPIFWFDSQKSFRYAMRHLRGLKRGISEFAAAFYTPGDRKDLGECMIYGYRDRRSRDRSFDNGKIAHEASHALEDFYKRKVGLNEDQEDDGTWWFSEGLAEFMGSIDVETVKDKTVAGGQRYVVKPINRNWGRMAGARRVNFKFSTRAVFAEGNIGIINFGRVEKTEPRDWPFTLRDLIDLRHGGDLDARAAVMCSRSGNPQMAQQMAGMIGSLAYFEAWALVTFLYESGGEYREVLMRCFDGRRNNKAHAVNNKVAFKGIDLDKLETEWLAWIEKVLKEKPKK